MEHRNPPSNPFTWQVLVAIAILYALAFALAWIAGGFWLAVRKVAAQLLIVLLWLVVADRLLRREADQDIPIRRPAFELALVVVLLLVIAASSAIMFATGAVWARVIFLAALVASPFLLLLLGYRGRKIGLSAGSRRAWLALLLIVLVNGLIGVGLGGLLPPSELPEPPGADLAERIGGPLDALLLVGQLIIVAALPEEFLLRVAFQPRLRHYLPLGWAILIQALVFNALHLPRELIRLDVPLPLALAYTLLTPANGLIAGYLWHKTGSLPLLIVLHVLAFPRYGL
jgi:membrane protease YdiL (CAAX protease family)